MSAGLTSGLDAARFDPAATLVADIGFTHRLHATSAQPHPGSRRRHRFMTPVARQGGHASGSCETAVLVPTSRIAGFPRFAAPP